MRRYAQISNATKFFMVLGDITVFDASGTIEPIMDQNSAAASLIIRSTQPTIVSGNILKDLGRTVTKYDPVTYEHTGVYRQVMLVNNIDAEGVGASTNIFYIKTWSPVIADADIAIVARTGPGVA